MEKPQDLMEFHRTYSNVQLASRALHSLFFYGCGEQATFQQNGEMESSLHFTKEKIRGRTVANTDQ